ncbi:MAG: glycosyl transferase family 2 [Candidatus Blackburnbacteria bacterium RIFCSPHIGHO2_01_FULL_44_64]|uniref:Glycosyl transferase family 2 n=1 Tax=Candidatus Blackburnbacteria bacterium RIFCSPHIGHO2_02_FULL_44_20 TaxID=1797516 RepID=A0A1G1V9F1_9BACT|nr:MAG: glycosyl transferase family 2 [Candidatus Blackburnbacteria bacterium RIFCSPHIGHO2_01_FULL_44_64]OGY10313.1 MAG: glycosyl transferase family 2 [Candidatus Blackburnbacteria bacterium RIFCSPHIGHO2_12_FULL_44_25]OGY11993.1 MAG: glycosyl transferase family 2 [Candidatus Blackburnbacteria bacterium RIFCSPHIGHO2_02_FULL_44_20]OGY14660.1 MAG: glycosyl transferase family 2 [Candidatus Blackburnbacteria bacterium RIFCSPLOWO2_01_FULL_44_43]
MQLSFVIPAKNEEGSIETLYTEIVDVVRRLKKTYQVIFIDDGSTDSTFQVMRSLHKKDRNVHVIKFRGNLGKSAALQVGFDQAQGDVVFTMDADLQDNPKEIPNFLAKLDEGYDLVSGWKKRRHDPSVKVIPSRILNNFLTPKLTGVRLHDINCGFKAYRREVVKTLNLYGELYRFIPVFAQKQAFRVTEIPVDHRARQHGKSKFGWERNIKGFLDLLTIVFLTGYNRRPGHFFGTFGLSSFFAGFVIGVYITYLRLTTGGVAGRQPLLIFGILLMIVGIQLISTGLLAEMMLATRGKPDYTSSIETLLK